MRALVIRDVHERGDGPVAGADAERGGHYPAGSWAAFVEIGNQSVWTGVNSDGEPGIGLVEVIGFGLNYLDVMSFCYLFLPTWFFTIIVYKVLAGRYGAREAYPEAEARFANPNIRDGVSRICSESSAKLPKFLLPTLRENLARGGEIRRAILLLAVYTEAVRAVYARGDVRAVLMAG